MTALDNILHLLIHFSSSSQMQHHATTWQEPSSPAKAAQPRTGVPSVTQKFSGTRFSTSWDGLSTSQVSIGIIDLKTSPATPTSSDISLPNPAAQLVLFHMRSDTFCWSEMVMIRKMEQLEMCRPNLIPKMMLRVKRT